MTETVTPTSFEGAAAILAEAAADQRTVRIVGGGTKLGWGGRPAGEPSLLLRTRRLDDTLEHNAGDLTAVFAAGAPLERVQAELASAGQMLAVDPPLGTPDAGPGQATIGGVFATGDCGPLRHRYGLPRDLILGITVALSDGTVARAGGRVIKNVAGYDLAKLFTGSFGTLGLILAVGVRLHPLPETSATAVGASGDPAVLGAASVALGRAPLELESLDVAWRGGRGGLLAQVTGPEAARRAARAAALMREAGLEGVEVTSQDASLWARQRAGQRSARAALFRISTRATELAAVLGAADAVDGTLVGRAFTGPLYLELPPQAIGSVRALLPAGTVAVALDRPVTARGLDPWGEAEPGALELMRSVKRGFDPAGICNPGVFVGGL
jgi:glycolate oxidase FAD binding subunit